MISMGGGHADFTFRALEEQTVSEYFSPQYADNASAVGPDYQLPTGFMEDICSGDCTSSSYLEYGGHLEVVATNASAVDVSRATIVRLGSVTHQFDMGQLYVELPVSGTWPEFTISGQQLTPNVAPPGYYMLFLLTDDGEPGEAQYIQIGGEEPAMFVCETGSTFAAIETSCSGEPVSGTCPSASTVSTTLTPPVVEGPSGPVSGFRVVAPPGAVVDPLAPDADELAFVQTLCASACTQAYVGRSGESANCGVAGVFNPPVFVESTELSVDLISPNQRHGEGLFPGQQLSCSLGADCVSEFDEVLDPVIAARISPAADGVSVGEEWVVSVSGSMEASSTHASQAVSAPISGTVGYSLCADGNASAPCPTYLGSVEMTLDSPLTISLTCGGNSQAHTIDSLTVRLGQPGFGIAEQGTMWHAFPPGALVWEAEGVVDGIPFASRRTNQRELRMRALDGWLTVQGIDGYWLQLGSECAGEEAEVLVWWGLDATAAPEGPPTVSIDVPSQVTCPSTVTLTGTKSDPQDDIAESRWRVDGVLMSAGTTAIPFTGPHTLEYVVVDDRGATTTATKAVSCL